MLKRTRVVQGNKEDQCRRLRQAVAIAWRNQYEALTWVLMGA